MALFESINARYPSDGEESTRGVARWIASSRTIKQKRIKHVDVSKQCLEKACFVDWLVEALVSPYCQVETISFAHLKTFLRIGPVLAFTRIKGLHLILHNPHDNSESSENMLTEYSSAFVRLKELLCSKECMIEELKFGTECLSRGALCSVKDILNHPYNRIRTLQLVGPLSESGGNEGTNTIAKDCFGLLERALTNRNCKLNILSLGMSGFDDKVAARIVLILGNPGCQLKKLYVQSVAMSTLTDAGMMALIAGMKASSLKILELPFSLHVSAKLRNEFDTVLETLQSPWFSVAVSLLVVKHSSRPICHHTLFQKVLGLPNIARTILLGIVPRSEEFREDEDESKKESSSSESESLLSGSSATSSDTSDEEYSADDDDANDDENDEEYISD